MMGLAVRFGRSRLLHRRSNLTHAVRIACLLFPFLFLDSPSRASDFEAYRGWSVASLEIRGVDKDLASKLKRGLALANSSGLLGVQRPPFFPDKLEEDLRRARLYLARRGFPDARITPAVDPRPKQERVAIVLHVVLGDPVTIQSLHVDSLPPTVSASSLQFSLQAGDRFTDADVARSTSQLQASMRDLGYARVHIMPEVAWADSSHVAVHFLVRPGPLSYFGDVRIEGVDEDLLPLTRRTIGNMRGERYSPRRLQDAREDLRALNLFQQYRLEIGDAPDDTVDVIATLVQRQSTSLEASLRYWTDEQIQGAARWTNRNLFKKGRGATAGISASPYLQRLDASAWWLGLMGAHTTTTGTLRTERESEESYTTVSSGGILSLRYNRSFQSSVRAGVDISEVQLTERVEGDTILAQDGLITALLLDASRRATDDPITATRGSNAGLSLEWAPDQLGSDNSYVLGAAAAALYVPVRPRTQVALRVNLGLGAPTGKSRDLLPNKRFFSGGAASHRGFHRRKLGPLDRSGAPLGGEAKLEASVELRFPLFWKLRGAAFADCGQVWRQPEDIDLGRLEIAVGPGLWLQTLIGPLRADWGYRLTDYDTTQPESVFHFSVGPAF